MLSSTLILHKPRKNLLNILRITYLPATLIESPYVFIYLSVAPIAISAWEKSPLHIAHALSACAYTFVHPLAGIAILLPFDPINNVIILVAYFVHDDMKMCHIMSLLLALSLIQTFYSMMINLCRREKVIKLDELPSTEVLVDDDKWKKSKRE